jgi:hypothetical protein
MPKWIKPVILGACILGGGMTGVWAVTQSQQAVTSTASTASTTSTTQTQAKVAAAPVAETAAQPSSTPAIPVANSQPTAKTADSPAQPSSGTVTEMVNGDLMCYLTIVDDRGKEHQVGATFELCEQQATFLNRSVNLFYQTVSVNDCQSIEPCGKSRQASLVTRMELVEAPQPSPEAKDSYTISNGEWTITVGNVQSWSGVNHTGNLSYSACNNKDSCLQLQGGQMNCRDGICTIGWQNGDYFYSLQSPITTDDQEAAARSVADTKLVVRQGDKIMLESTGFKLIQ